MTGDTGVSVHRQDRPLDEAAAIRRQVFVEGQSIPESEEFDGRDGDAIQVLARVDGTPVGTARLRTPEPGLGKVERVAVLPAYRGAGWGRRLLETVETVARRDGLDKLVLHAQTTVEGFYRESGYEVVSDVYLEVGIPHVTMEQSL